MDEISEDEISDILQDLSSRRSALENGHLLAGAISGAGAGTDFDESSCPSLCVDWEQNIDSL
jgi:hypothetical protein